MVKHFSLVLVITIPSYNRIKGTESLLFLILTHYNHHQSHRHHNHYHNHHIY